MYWTPYPITMLPSILLHIEALYGPQQEAAPRQPWPMVLWEISAYLASDERRAAAFEALRQLTALDAERILSTPLSTLKQVTALGGVFAELRAERLHLSASLLTRDYQGDLDQVLTLPAAKAIRALTRFPMIGKPGAEKILLFCGAHPILALESNGLRTLLRLGYGKQQKNYEASYRSAREAAALELPAECEALIRAHLLLRRHGQEICLRQEPVCYACPLGAQCPSRLPG